MKLVIGGAGFVGSWVVQKLRDKEEDVRVLDRNNRPEFIDASVEYIKGDACKTKNLKSALQDVETVYLVAGQTGVGESIENPQKFYRDNVRPAELLTKISDNFPVKNLVYSSAVRVYGEGKYECRKCGLKYPMERNISKLQENVWNFACNCGNELKPVPVKENDPVNPRTPYSRSKLYSEYYLRDSLSKNINLKILRYPLVYGPRHKGAVNYFFSTVLEGKSPKLFEDGKQLRNFTYVEDVAETTIKSPDKKESIYNIGHTKSLTLERFNEKLMELADREISLNVSKEFRPHDIRNSVIDTTRFHEDYNLELTSHKDAIKKTLRYHIKG